MSSHTRRLRVGIDVGGTFTHAVAIDSDTLTLVARHKVPTTHRAAEGVARGVVEALEGVIRAGAIHPSEVLLIAHSTTQATNALLEGDVSPVGVIGMGSGAGALFARAQTRIPSIPLSPDHALEIHHVFVRSEKVTVASVEDAIAALVARGAKVIVAAEAFSVDDPARETLVCRVAAERGVPATATHHVSRLHGLGIRTRTAVINASMIPRMLATADMTERAVRAAGFIVPLMVMRSDGGLMTIEEMRRRPILTMLSGPAAGVAAALLFARISDGVFLEVGGTSTDICAIKNGRCLVRSAEIGGQKLHVSTLDVRTVGVAGGSLVELGGPGRVSAVGPRSAHIAALPYLSFSSDAGEKIESTTLRHEQRAYAGVRLESGSAAITPTCASNELGLVPDGDVAHGAETRIHAGFARLAAGGGFTDGRELATQLLTVATDRVAPIVEGLIRDYKLNRGVIRLVGGGGGAAAIVPFLAQRMGMSHELVQEADVVSAIGAALALVRDSVERTVIDPTEEDIRRIRAEAVERVERMGAAPATIRVFVEVDSKRNLLRATAEGSSEIRQTQPKAHATDAESRNALVASSIGGCESPPQVVASVGNFEVWTAQHVHRRLGGVFRDRRRAIRVLDAVGSIRWASNHGDLLVTSVADSEKDMERLAESLSVYSDVGATIPRCFVLDETRLIDLSGLVDIRQVNSVLRFELQSSSPSAPCALLVSME